MTNIYLPDERSIDSQSQANNPVNVAKNPMSMYEQRFNEIYTKRKYFKKLRQIYNTCVDSYSEKNWNEMLIQDYIASMVPLCTRKYCNYEVIKENGEYILIKKRIHPYYLKIKVLSAEECFPVILEAHKESRHGDIEAILNITKSFCEYPIFCITLLLLSCNVCKEMSKSYTIKRCTQIMSTKSIWKFILYKMSVSSRLFQYLFIYMELETKYVVIRPLIKLSYEDISMELMKIFLTFGPPKKILVSRQHEDLLVSTLELLANLDPTYFIQVEKYHDYLQDICSVNGLLQKWYEKTCAKDWEVGCRFMQWKLNTSLRIIGQGSTKQELIAGVPYNLFFGSEANTANDVGGDMTSDQIFMTSRSQITLGVYSKVQRRRKSTKIVDQVVDFSSDESDNEFAEKDIVLCGVCKEEYAMYSCATCCKPLHYKCGTRIQFVERNNVIQKFVCISCT